MIKSLSVKGLNHRIDVDLEFNEDLNIITGKNGSGKTTLLKLLWYLISGNLERIVPEIPFQMVSIETDSFTLSLEQDKQSEDKVCAVLVDYELREQSSGNFDKNYEGVRFQFDNVEEMDRYSIRIAELMKRSLFFSTFRRIEGGYVNRGDIDNPDSKTTSPLELLQQSMEEYASEISTNGHRFIAAISVHDIDGLLRRNSDAIYESLRPFTVFAGRMFDVLQYKSLNISSEITVGEAEEAIALNKLSSGEKQMLSFLCYNAFNENSAIFIDEPELSLHVDWQRLLLPTLLEQGTENQFFIATHSPFIYAKYPDKEIPLGDKGGTN